MTITLFRPAMLLAFAATGAPARTQSDPAEFAAFLQLTATQKEQVAARIAKELPPSAVLRALRACAEEATKPHPERTKRFTERHGKRVVAGEAPDTAMPLGVSYVFGVGIIESLPQPAAGVAAAKKRPSDTKSEELAIPVHQALLGITPGADRALAALMQRLDQDTRGDRYAAFLHAWRNGHESFYEALDRTAGTKDAVFFYDAMLHDFRSQFAGSGAPALAPSLQAAHDALHDAFLATRSRRGARCSRHDCRP